MLRYVPLDVDIAIKMAEVPRQDIPDLPDRGYSGRGFVLQRSGAEPGWSDSFEQYQGDLVTSRLPVIRTYNCAPVARVAKL